MNQGCYAQNYLGYSNAKETLTGKFDLGWQKWHSSLGVAQVKEPKNGSKAQVGLVFIENIGQNIALTALVHLINLPSCDD